jgi:hypothetical protein
VPCAAALAACRTRASIFKMKIDDDTASRLYDHSTSAARVHHKESNAEEIRAFSILGVPCDITFGFSTKGKHTQPRVEACVWIFNTLLNEFYGSYYLPVVERGHALTVLNSTIARAIDQAKTNEAFKTAFAREQAKGN